MRNESQNIIASSPQDSSFQLCKITYRKWTLEDNKKYITFLGQNAELFSTEAIRRKEKVFKRLSKFMGNKNTNQCKSHHQKMMAKDGDIHQTIKKLSEKIHKITMSQPIPKPVQPVVTNISNDQKKPENSVPSKPEMLSDLPYQEFQPHQLASSIDDIDRLVHSILYPSLSYEEQYYIFH